MRILKDLKIRMKMILGFGCILFLLVVMNGVSLVNMRKISNKAVEVVTRSENFSQTDVTMITDQANGVILVQDILFVLIVIAALVTAFKMSRDITKPLRELEDNMKLLSKGNFDITIRNDSLDEIGQLGRQMKKMSEDMKRYIRDITGTLGEIADGNVTVMVSGEYEGEYREIKSSLNLIAGSLNEVVEQMQTCAVQVERGAQGLSGNATDLSAGAMKQASAIEEFRRYLSRVSDLTKEDAKNAVMIKEIAGKAMKAVKESNTQMDRMREAMSNIASSSQEIEKVSKIIEDIALQTNILALNAATEAARAGEAGKGFSVVADEVRSLAAKSKEAAGTITTMINGSVNLVQGGLEVSETMSSCLSEVKNQVVSVSDQLINIDSSTREQAEAFGVMEDSLENIQEIVSSNTAAAEHNAEASGELIAQSDALNKMIRRFHLSV